MVRTFDARAAAGLIAGAIWLMAWLTAPDAAAFGTQPVAPAGITYFPGNSVGQPMPIAEGVAQLARAAKAGAPGTLRQLHFTLPTGTAAALYLPSAPANSVVWVNGLIGGESASPNYVGPGFGPNRLTLEIPVSRLGFETNRLDIIALQGWPGGRTPLILVTPANTGPAFAALMDRTEMRLWRGAAALGGLGLVLSLAGLLLLRSRMLYIGSAVFSAALLNHAFGLVPSGWGLGVALAGIAVIMAQVSRRHRVLQGMLAAAGFAMLAAIAMSLGWAASLTLAWCANVTLWPLAGLGLPLLTMDEGRLVWADFIAARARIGEQAALIARQQSELQESIRIAAVAEERQRFVRDVHDGIGGHLLSLLMRVRTKDADSTEVASELEQGLTDLRLMVDSLDHVGHDLETALAAFERRARQQLTSAGLEFTWSKPLSLGDVRLDARAVLSLFRIMQETLTNCIRHAQANQFGLQLDAADNARLNIVMEDDGTGFSPETIDEGRGLANIRRRVEKLGGTVVFGPGAGGKGSRTSLTIPVG